MTIPPNTPSDAPVTPERLAQMRELSHCNPLLYSSFKECLQHIDWREAKIAELERGVAIYNEDAQRWKNWHDALQARLTAAQSFVPKAVQRFAPAGILGVKETADGWLMYFADHAAIVADLTTALNLANARADGAEKERDEAQAGWNRSEEYCSRKHTDADSAATERAVRDAEIVALREALQDLHFTAKTCWDAEAARITPFRTTHPIIEKAMEVLSRTSVSYAGKTVINAAELAELRAKSASVPDTHS